MVRFMKKLHRGEKGLTLIELLIVVAILGILAAIIVPNLVGFLTTGKVAAANTEVANVESAALAYFADNDGDFPTDSSFLEPPATYLSGPTVYGSPYTIDQTFGTVTGATPTDAADGIEWDMVDDKWIKSTGE
jgi:prepilin-type N-terminal cleavage/methylation domain-containing protein